MKIKLLALLAFLNCSQLILAQNAIEQNSFLNRLKKAKEFNCSDNRFIPEFTYLSKEDPNLIKIRHNLKLDSIAGKANEISKILNILHWVHYVVWHDGEADKPASMNTLDLISYQRIESRGMNCRMMATILNECYLSLGIKSRLVTCMPKELDYEECHVINAVYSEELGKWIWVDPTFDAYVMNEKGELLGLMEVRERLINNKTLILNPEANWNRLKSETKEGYLYEYMAKNLYRLQCQLVSGFNTETHSAGKEITYVDLLPLDGIGQEPQHEEAIKEGVKTIHFKTNNPDLFWAKPRSD
jgi:hypothetical protein